MFTCSPRAASRPPGPRGIDGRPGPLTTGGSSSASTPPATSSSTSRDAVDLVIDVRPATPERDSGVEEAMTVRATRLRLLARNVDCRAPVGPAPRSEARTDRPDSGDDTRAA